MGWIFSAFMVVSIIHMVEEYVYPGGFMDVMRRLNPGFAPAVTVPMALVINGLQLLLCVLAILVGTGAPIFSMSVAGLLLINGLIYVGASFRVRGYAPGVISGVLLYIPLAVYGYVQFIQSGRLTPNQAIFTAVLGLLYQAVPITYLVLSRVARRS